jgi:hypothetical protein
MRLKTQTRENGVPGVRDVKWGLEVLLTVATLFLGIIAAWVNLNQQLAAGLASQVAFQDEVKRRIIESTQVHGTFVTKDQYAHHNHDGKVPSEGSN